MRRRTDRSETRVLELVERMLDKGIVEEDAVVVRVPLLDLDVVGLRVSRFVGTRENYPDYHEALEPDDENTVEALPPDEHAAE